MIDIDLQPVANQELSIPLDGARYVLRVKESNGAMVMSVIKDGVTIIQNARMVADNYVLPYDYMHPGQGNFFIGTQAEEIPFYTEFGRTQFMVFATAAEIAGA